MEEEQYSGKYHNADERLSTHHYKYKGGADVGINKHGFLYDKGSSVSYSLTGKMFYIFVPILIFAIVLTFGSYSRYDVFDLEAFATSLSKSNELSEGTKFLIEVDNNITNWLDQNNGTFGVNFLAGIYNAITKPIEIVFQLYQSLMDAQLIAKDIFSSFTNGTYWQKQAIPDDIQQYFYDFSS